MERTPDPFSLIYQHTMQALAEDVTIRSYVREGNLIDFTQTFDPQKRGVSSADVPELVLYQAALTGNFHASSGHAMLDSTWRFVISTGTFQSSILSGVSFGVVRTLMRWHDWLRPVLWNESQFVKNVQLITQDSGASIPEANRNIQGWATIMDINVSVAFSLTDLRTVDS